MFTTGCLSSPVLALPATRGDRSHGVIHSDGCLHILHCEGKRSHYDEAVVSRRFHLHGSILGIRDLEGGAGAQDTVRSSLHCFPLKTSEQRLDSIPWRDIAQPSDEEGLGCLFVASHLSSGASRPRRGKERHSDCKMLLVLGTNWGPGVLLGGGPLCALQVLSHCPVSPMSINFSYAQQRA